MSADGRLVAQDIEIVMDAGAYCTLSPVVLSRGTLHAGGPYHCPNVRIRSRAVATNTPPNGAFRGFGAPQTEFAAEMQVNRIAEALAISPLELRRRWLYRPGDTTPTGQVLRESVAAEEVLERAAEASEFERVRARTAARREPRELTGTDRGDAHGPRDRPGARLARRRLHRLGRGPPRVGRLGRADGRGPDRDPDRLDRDGPGDQDDLPADRRRGARRADGRRRAGVGRHRPRARQRPDGRLADGDGRRRPRDRRLPPAAGRRRGAQRRPVRDDLPGRCPGPRGYPDRRALRAVPGRRLRRHDLPRRCLSRVRLGVGDRRGRRRSRHRRGGRPERRRRRRRRPGDPSRSWPRARSRAARCRRSATRRSRRSS